MSGTSYYTCSLCRKNTQEKPSLEVVGVKIGYPPNGPISLVTTVASVATEHICKDCIKDVSKMTAKIKELPFMSGVETNGE